MLYILLQKQKVGKVAGNNKHETHSTLKDSRETIVHCLVYLGYINTYICISYIGTLF
jgi:hypothetical protein